MRRRTKAGSPLSPEAAIRLLRRWGLLDDASFVNGDVWVTEVRGRNVNLRVDTTIGPGLFLKQVAAGESRTPMRTESWFYRRVLEPRGAPLRRFVPRLARTDPARRLLVLELVPDARPIDALLDEAAAADVPPPDAPLGKAPGQPLGKALGKALGVLHRLFRFRRGTPGGVAHPWILDLVTPRVEMLRHISPAQLELVRVIQAHPSAAAALDGLRDAWTPTTLIHGDVKWSNVLVAGSTDATARNRLPDIRLVDWEFASWGDPAWDVGSALHAFLVDAIAHAALTAGDARSAAAAFGRALPGAWPEIRAFADAYAAERTLGRAAAEACIAAAIRFAAARLVQTAWESSEAADTMPNYAAGELQLALNVLERPADAQAAVFGLGEPPEAA